MAEDLDAELEDYWKGSADDDEGTAKVEKKNPVGKKRVVSLTGGRKKATPVKKKLIVTQRKKNTTPLNTKAEKPSKLDQPLSSGNRSKVNRPLSKLDKPLSKLDQPLSSGSRDGAQKPKSRPQQRPKRQRREFFRNQGNNRSSRQGNPFHPQSLAKFEERPNSDTVVFPGKTKLFIGGLPEDYTQAQLQNLLEPYGALSECYLPNGKAFAIVTFNSRECAYKAQVGLSGRTLEGGRALKVRPSPDAAVWVGDLPNIATNELLKQAFSRFGPINRAIVCCDTRGRSLGYGIVEFAYKGSATNCIETCTTQPFLLSRSPQPVRVEPYRYKEEDVGLPAKEVLLERFYWGMIQSECNGPGPRMGTQEPIGMEWLKLYQQQKIAKQALKEKFQEERKELGEKMNQWFEDEEREMMQASEGIRSQRMEIMRREEQLRSHQAQLSAASAQIGFGAW